MGLAPGYLVSKHVKLVRMLKRGGMGSVWIADHLALQTQVAVKFMSVAAAEDADMVARFSREATSAAQIKSPHVVQVHDHGVTAEGEPFIVMELLEGEDLSAKMKRDGRMGLEEVATILLQTSRVLGKAHQTGIVHRDIKPSNIFLVDNHGDLFIKVLDFGVAKMGNEGSELTLTGALVGTVVYMSPEQLLSARKVDHRADLWSLAVVAYRAITGELPFKDDDGIGALCKALQEEIFFPPSAFVPDLPPELDAWFDRAFKRDPNLRFSSAREFADEFFQAIGKTSGLAPVSAPSMALQTARDAAVAEALSAVASPPTAATNIEPRRRPPPSPKPSNEETISVTRASRTDPEEAAAPSAPASKGRPETLAGTASGAYPAVRVGAGKRRAVIVVASLGALAALGFVGAVYFGKIPGVSLGFLPSRAPAASIAADPGAATTAHAVTMGSQATPNPGPLQGPVAPAPAPTTLPATSVVPVPSAVPASSAAPTASAASSAPAAPSASGKGFGKAGSSSHKPPKDYGF